jgi:urease accessory protein
MTRLDGGATLEAATVGGLGPTHLSRVEFRPPVHISKPHHDGEWLVVNLASPSPGLLEGDCVALAVTCRTGARLCVTTPSAMRLHAMPGGGAAHVMNSFRVEHGAFLEYLPEYLIPQRESALTQRTDIAVEAGGGYFGMEPLAPGRAAMGENQEYRVLQMALDARLDGTLICRERYTLCPRAPWTAPYETPYYASILLIHPQSMGLSAALHSTVETGGFSEPEPGVVVGKVLAGDSLTLKGALGRVRERVYTHLGMRQADVRRNALP